MTTIKEEILKELKEKLADIEHQRWSDWMKYVFSVCSFSQSGTLNGKGKAIIPEKYKKGWLKQINTDYKDLTEKEKDSDREQVDRYLPFLSQSIDKVVEESKQQQIKLLEEVKKEIIGEDNGGTGHVYFYKKQLRKDLDSKITNLKKEL